MTVWIEGIGKRRVLFETRRPCEYPLGSVNVNDPQILQLEMNSSIRLSNGLCQQLKNFDFIRCGEEVADSGSISLASWHTIRPGLNPSSVVAKYETSVALRLNRSFSALPLIFRHGLLLISNTGWGPHVFPASLVRTEKSLACQLKLMEDAVRR